MLEESYWWNFIYNRMHWSVFVRCVINSFRVQHPSCLASQAATDIGNIPFSTAVAQLKKFMHIYLMYRYFSLYREISGQKIFRCFLWTMRQCPNLSVHVTGNIWSWELFCCNWNTKGIYIWLYTTACGVSFWCTLALRNNIFLELMCLLASS